MCEIPYNQLEELGAQIPSLMRLTVRIMGKEILRDKRLMQITKNSAPGKLAAFLLGLSERFLDRGFAAQEYQLSMSRIDIGSYLGLADETVSRLFTRFQEDGLLAVERKRIRLIDIPGLQAVARGLTERAPPIIYIGGGMYSKQQTEQEAPKREGHTGFLSWDPIYSIGVDVIDQQHQKLFDISNRFYETWRRRVRGAALSRIFDELYVLGTDREIGTYLAARAVCGIALENDRFLDPDQCLVTRQQGKYQMPYRSAHRARHGVREDRPVGTVRRCRQATLSPNPGHRRHPPVAGPAAVSGLEYDHAHPE